MIVPGHNVPNSFKFPALKSKNMLSGFLAAPIIITLPPCDRIQDGKNNVLPLLIDTLSFLGYRSLPRAVNMQPHSNSRIAQQYIIVY